MLEGRDIAMTAEDRRITYSSLTEVICLGIEPMLGELADNYDLKALADEFFDLNLSMTIHRYINNAMLRYADAPMYRSAFYPPDSPISFGRKCRMCLDASRPDTYTPPAAALAGALPPAPAPCGRNRRIMRLL